MRVSDKDVLAECSASPSSSRSDGSDHDPVNPCPTTDEDGLRQRARDAIRAGKIPPRPPARMWGGPGSDAECIVCGVPVSTHEIGYELDLAQGDEAQRFNPHVHIHCFSAWSAAAADILRSDPGDCTISRREHDISERHAPD